MLFTTCPRNAESLATRVRSKANVELLSGILTTLPPPEGVSEIELITIAKESMDVPGGGARGSAATVRLSEALPPTGPQSVQGFLTPLQYEREREKTTASATRNTLRFEFIQVPHEGFEEPPQAARAAKFPHNTVTRHPSSNRAE